jgi:hypothetical protein
MKTSIRKVVLAGAASLTLAGGLAASTDSAQARWFGPYGYGYRHFGYGPFFRPYGFYGPIGYRPWFRPYGFYGPRPFGPWGFRRFGPYPYW